MKHLLEAHYVPGASEIFIIILHGRAQSPTIRCGCQVWSQVSMHKTRALSTAPLLPVYIYFIWQPTRHELLRLRKPLSWEQQWGAWAAWPQQSLPLPGLVC